MSKTTVKLHADSDTHKIRFEYADNQGEELAKFINGLLEKAAQAQAHMAEAERFERLSKSVSDRELARYYAERAKELKG